MTIDNLKAIGVKADPDYEDELEILVQPGWEISEPESATVTSPDGSVVKVQRCKLRTVNTVPLDQADTVAGDEAA